MGSIHFNDARLEINSVNVSAYVRSVTLNQSADELDDTAMGDSYRSRLGGLKDWSIDVEFNQDYAASATDATLSAIAALSNPTTTLKLRPTTAAISTTNPEWNGTGLLKDYGAVDGGIGDLLTAKASFSGAGAIDRDVTP